MNNTRSQRQSYELDTDDPPPARQRVINDAFQANASDGRPPYYGVVFRTLGELNWVMRMRNWRGDVISDDPTSNERANLEGARFENGNFIGMRLLNANLRRTRFVNVNLNYAGLIAADVSNSILFNVELVGGFLNGTNFTASQLIEVNLANSNAIGMNLSGTRLERANLSGVVLAEAQLDSKTYLAEDLILSQSTIFVDIIWDDVSLTRVNWSQVPILGDEVRARRKVNDNGETKSREQILKGYQLATRANRQMATVLLGQGLNDEADRFAFKAKVLQREIFKQQEKFGSYIWWSILEKLTGFGFRPGYTLLWYLGLLLVSTLVFWWQGMTLAHPSHIMTCTLQHVCTEHTLPPPEGQILGESFVESITAIHGRGFFPGQLQTFWQWFIAAFDAVAGLIIEVSFVATFVQRFFAR